MFRQITRNSTTAFRRAAHQYYSTSTSSAAHASSRRRLGFILGSAVVGISYTMWSMTDVIALDSQRPPAAERVPQKPKPKQEPVDLEPIAASQATPDAAAPFPTTTSDTDPSPSFPSSDSPSPSSPTPETAEVQETLEPTSTEASQQGAYNPETGEINWDCPCLGGMAHGPCGPQFREAFSCFIYSEDEPKGINCVEKFKGMQDCFREHPEVYADEIMDDDDDDEAVDAIAAKHESTPTPTPGADVATPPIVSGDEAPAPVAGSSPVASA